MVLVIKNMSERKRRAPLSEKEKEEEKREEDDDKYEASQQDMQIEVPDATNAIRTQENAIEPVVKENTTTLTTTTATNFHLMTQEEKDLTIKVRNAGDALYDLVLSAIEKVKIILAQKVKELAAKDRYQSDCNCS